MSPSTTLLVDCHGPSHQPELVCDVDDVRVRFVYDDGRKDGLDFSYGLFVDDAGLSRAYLRYPKDRRFWLLQESPIRGVYREVDRVAHRFRRIFTHWRPLFERGEPFRRFLFGTSWLGDTDTSGSFEKSKDVSFIGSVLHGDHHGYALRNRVAEALMEDARVDCYGYGIREIPTKIDGLADYRFSVALENTREDDYFSEKLVDCFLTETVPIYWGAPGITELFDPDGMLIFDDLDDLWEILEKADEERYEAMLPHVRANKRKAIDEGWDTRQAQHGRLGRELVEDPGPKPPSRVRLRAVDTIRKLRRVMRGLGRE